MSKHLRSFLEIRFMVSLGLDAPTPRWHESREWKKFVIKFMQMCNDGW